MLLNWTGMKPKMESLKNLQMKSNDWLFGFYGISTFVGYLMPNPFLNK